jgi:hypothetical protein
VSAVDRDVELRCVGVGREALPDLNLAIRTHTFLLARWLVVLVRAPVHSDADNGVAVSAAKKVGFGKVQDRRGRSEYNISSIQQLLPPAVTERWWLVQQVSELPTRWTCVPQHPPGCSQTGWGQFACWADQRLFMVVVGLPVPLSK